MEQESLFIVCQRADGEVTTWTQFIGINENVMSIINSVKHKKDWMGGKFTKIHTMCDGKRFDYDHTQFNHLL